MLDFFQKYFSCGNGKQRSSSAHTIEKKRVVMQKYVCEKCRKELSSPNLYEIHKSTYCPGVIGAKSNENLFPKKTITKAQPSLQYTVNEGNTKGDEKEKKKAMDKSIMDKTQDNQFDEMMSSSTSSIKVNSPNPSITRKRKGGEPVIVTYKVKEEEEDTKDIKILGDQEVQSESLLCVDPVDRLIAELKGKTIKERQLLELKFIEENIPKKSQTVYIVCDLWIKKYTDFLNGTTSEGPGPINNAAIKQKIAAGHVFQNIYTVNDQVWKFMHKLYGGGPEIPQPNRTFSGVSDSDKNSEPLTADTMSRSEANDSLRTSLTEPYKSPAKKGNFHLKPVGMQNESFYCYMNSCLQGLLSIGEFAQYVSDERYKKVINDKNYKFWKGINDVVLSHNKRGSDCVPRFLRRISSNIFDPDEQHDAHEYLRFVLSGLQDEINLKRPKKEVEITDPETSWAYYRKYNVSIIDELFAGQLVNRVLCCTCNHVSTTFDPFLDLSLPINPGKSKNIDDCLENFQKEEEIKDGYVCEKCKTKTKAIKRLFVSKFPKYLVIHLKRFQTYPKKRKLIDTINFPVDNWSVKRMFSKEKNDYSLIGSIVHRGSFDSGHYICYTKRAGEWLLCDDETVKTVSGKEVASREAYVLIYERKN